MKTHLWHRVLLLSIFCSILSPLKAQQVNPNPWVTKTDTTAETVYKNPVIPGFYPDPTVCKVGDDFYLANSSFEYFPGLPIFHSKDLIHWQQIGHGIHRKDQLPDGLNIFAPTLRHHKGKFYLITTNVGSGGNFYISADRPEGPWSDPIFIEVGGIDPDLFFDDNGKSYVVNSNMILTEIDLETGKLLGEQRKIWHGSGGRFPEAPHLYKKDGFYFLMAAEGGTEEAHMVTIARSNDIWGPYIENPSNPIATHVNVAGMRNPIQGIGHADLVQANDESWWMLLHGYRSQTGYPPHHILGRETCLVPVDWPKGAWPIVNGNGTVQIDMKIPSLKQKPFDLPPNKTDFETALGLEWNHRFPFDPEQFQLDRSAGRLSIRGASAKMGEKGSVSFVGRRLTASEFAASTQLSFVPAKSNEEAGMILTNNGAHYDFVISREDQNASSAEQLRFAQVRLQFGQTTYLSNKYPLQAGSVTLKIEGKGEEFVFSLAQNGGEFQEIERADMRFLSTETVGWFTGVYVGLYATGNGETSETRAHYQWFEYKNKN